MTTVCGLVLKMGDLCYHDKDKFPKGPWCQLNEWVIFSRYAGSRFKIDGGEVRVLNDDEVISTIKDPTIFCTTIRRTKWQKTKQIQKLN